MEKLEDFIAGPLGFQRRGDVIISSKHREVLDAAGLGDFDAFFNAKNAEYVKHVRNERATFRLTLDVGGRAADLYVKKTEYNPLARKLRSFLKMKKENPSALYELANLVAFREAGLPVAEPVAAGFRRRGRTCETFVATAALPATRRLSEHVAENWKGVLSGGALESKRNIIKDLARDARRMHDAGFNHRDFYLVHFLLDERTGGLYLLDLNRAGRHARLGTRWIVKDLAGLDFSAPAGAVSSADRVRFLKLYLGTERLGAAGRVLAKKARRKSRAMAPHAQKARRRDALYVKEKGGALP